MKSYTTLRNLFGSLTNNTDSNNLTLGDQWINDGNRLILGAASWWFMEDTKQLSTTASVQYVDLPANFQKLESVYVTLGSTNYVPKECPDRQTWDRLNQTTTTTSNIPEYYFIFGKRLFFWPIPSTSNTDAVTIVYKKSIKDLSIADYSTGSVVSIANGGTAVVGTGTTWTAAMVGRYIRITDSDTANKGDGEWYEIGSYTSATSIALARPYEGESIVTGTAAYVIGQMPPYPETYHMLPVWYATWQYYSQRDELQRAQLYQSMFNNTLKQMKGDVSQKSISVVLDPGIDPYQQTNPNLFVRL